MSSLDISYQDTSSTLQDYIALLKPRVMSLVVFTALCGALMAPGYRHPFLIAVGILCVALGAGAAGCLNMWIERTSDKIMARTKTRPLPAGRMDPDSALGFGVILAALSVLIMAVAVGHVPAGYLAFTIFFYVIIYTVCLKPYTDQSIVIGGLAGAMPPLIGWTVVNPQFDYMPFLLVAIIFFWTPAHFWALCLTQAGEYQKASIPMLPNTRGIKATKKQIGVYTLITVLATLCVSCHSVMVIMGIGYLGLTGYWLYGDHPKGSINLFWFSIFYLFVVFLIMTFEALYP